MSKGNWQNLLLHPVSVVVVTLVLLALGAAVAYRKYVLLILRSLARNLRRTLLTSLAIFVLVFVITQIWSVLWFLNLVTEEKSNDFKAIVTERWQLPSQMPFSYAGSLSEGAAAHPEDVRPVDSMTWQFYGGTIDPSKRTRESIVFFFCMEPAKILTMMDGLDELTPQQRAQLEVDVKTMQDNKRGAILGKDRLAALNKKVGERITVTAIGNFKDINLEVEIIGEFAASRYDQSAILNRAYLNDALDSYNTAAKSKGQPKHPMTEKTLNLVWLKVPDTRAFNQVSEQIMSSSLYTAPAVKIETASSGVASFLDAYRDILWGIRWLLVPAMLVIMSLVMAITISISVRERRAEMAVMKVLGFRPGTIMGLVLGEAMLLGVTTGFISSFVTWYLVNHVMGGVKFPIAFFPAFFIPAQALLWGPALGGVTAFAGSVLPAWAARSVKVSEVFSKVS